MNDFLRDPVPALRDSHSQILKIAQVVKDPGRELGEGGVTTQVPIHPQPHDTWEEEEGRKE